MPCTTIVTDGAITLIHTSLYLQYCCFSKALYILLVLVLVQTHNYFSFS